MTPQEWIACAPDFEAAGNCTPETMVHEASFVTEGAQHLAAALEEIAQLREQVAELGRPSDLRLCGSCRQTRCMAQKERQYGKTCWMYSPNTNRDVQELRDEIARLQAQLAQAERVVVPELDAPTVCGLIEAYDDDPREINGVRTSENINAWFRENSHSVPASRVLKDGEVAVSGEEWDAAGNLLFSARAAWVECETFGECDMSAVTKAAKAWDSLRAQGKEGSP